MRSVQTKKFQWLATPSAWQEAQAWRNRRLLMLQRFKQGTDVFLAGLAAAQSDQITGSVTLASQMAMTRIKAQTKAKFDTLDSLAKDNKLDSAGTDSSVDKTA